MDVTMTEAQIKDAIVKMSNSEEYLELRKYYAEESLIKILHVSRDEKVHSNFVAWLLNPGSHHELNFYPLQKFLQMLSIIAKKENNSLARFSDEYVDRFLLEDYELSESCEVKTEVPTGKIAGFDNDGRIDILITLSFKGSDKILPIIIENKVLSTENDENKKNKSAKKNKQTEKYYDWAEEKYNDKTKYETPILIFLAPDFERDIVCKCDAFVKVSYQNLVDYLIEPCLMYTTNNQAKFFIENYLRCLSNSTLNNTVGKKECRIMAFSSKEKELLEKFHEKNKDLFDAVLMMVEQDEEDETMRKKISAARSASRAHDNTKYNFFENPAGNPYRKGRLVLAVVKQYVADNPKITFEELEKAFPKELRGGSGVVQLFDDVSPEDRGENGGIKRYYVKDDDEEKITLNGVRVLVSDQWGGADKMEKFIQHAKELGYNIEPV